MEPTGVLEAGAGIAPLRNSGIEAVGAIPWGTHFCQFYSSKDELLETLVPYIKAGIEANEYCVVVTSADLSAAEAEAALRAAMPNFSRAMREGRIEFVGGGEWYNGGAGFDPVQALESALARLEHALSRGFEGLRGAGAGAFSWLAPEKWKDFIRYESSLDAVLGTKRMLAFCSYPLSLCGPQEILNAATNHEFSLMRKDGRWQVLENAGRSRIEREFKKYVSLAENSSEFVGICDVNFVPRFINEAGLKMIGLKKIAPLRQASLLDLFFPEDRTFIQEKFLPRALAGNRAEVEIRFRHFRSGKPIWMICNVFLLKDSAGAPAGLATVSRNITERKLAEDAARWNAKRSAILSGIASRLLKTHDAQAEVKELCERAMEFLGCDTFFNFLAAEGEDRLHLNAYAGIQEAEARAIEFLSYETSVSGRAARNKCRIIAEDVANSHAPMTVRLKYFGISAYCCHPLIAQDRVIGTLAFGSRGRPRFHKQEIDMMAAVAGLLAMAISRTQAKAALLAAEERFRGIFERALAGIAIVGRDGRIEQCNPAFLGLLGYSERELRGVHFSSLIHPDDRAADVERVRLLSAGEAESFVVESRYIHKNGEPVWVRKVISFLPGKNGLPSRVFAVAIGIGEAKRAEAALREREERLGAIVNSAVDGIAVIDCEGIIQSINPAAEQMFGYSPDEVRGKDIGMFMPEGYRLRFRARKARGLLANALGGAGRQVEVECQRRDGTVFPAELSVAPWEVDGKRYFTGIVRDATQRKRREEKIGILQREVNHRSKNLLSLVQAIASQTAACGDPNAFARRFSERLRALAASQDLLVKSEWHGISLEELAKSQLAHFRDLLGKRIELGGPPLRVMASAAQSIGMALHELATNAGKYGALCNGTGRIAISWVLGTGEKGEPRFFLRWTETAGPPVEVPARRGFGSTVMEVMPRMELDGNASLDFAPEGLRWRLDCPAENVLDAEEGMSALGKVAE